MWADAITGLALGQQTAAARPTLTNGRFSTTAVNFDIAGGTRAGLYLIQDEDITVPASGATFKFFHNPKVSYHILVNCRFTGVNGSANQVRTVLTTGPVNGVGSPINTSGVGFILAQDNTGNLKKILARTYNRTGLVIDSTSAANGWDATYTPGSLIEACYDATLATPQLETIANFTQKSTAGATATAVNSNSAFGLLVGCQAQGILDTVNYTLPFYGYIEDIVVFDTTCLTGQQLQDLHAYFEELRGNPYAIYNLNGSNASTAFSPSGSVQETIAAVGASSFSFSPSGSINLTEVFAGNSSLSFSPSGSINLTEVTAGDAPTTFDPSVNPQLVLTFSGNSPSSFTPNGTVQDNVSVTGDVATTYLPDGTVVSTLQVNGDAPLTFDASGSVTQELAVTGDATTSFDLTPGEVQELAAFADAQMAFDGSGDLHNIEELDGDVAYSWTPDGSIISELAVQGDAPTAFVADTAVYQDFSETSGVLTSFDVAGETTAETVLAGDAATAFLVQGVLVDEIGATGDAATAFVSEGILYQDFAETEAVTTAFVALVNEVMEVAVVGDSPFDFVPTGTVGSALATAGDVTSSFDTEGTLYQDFVEAGDAPTSFVAAVEEVSEVAVKGTSSFAFTFGGDVEVTLRAYGDAQTSFDTVGDLNQDFALAGDASSAFTLAGEVALEHEASGDVQTSFVVAGTVINLLVDQGDASITFTPDGGVEQTHALVANVPFGFVVDGNLITNALSGILLGVGDVTGHLAASMIFGGQVTGKGILEDPYDVLFPVTLDGAGDLAGTLEKGVILRALALSGAGTLAESVPLPLTGHGDLSAYLDVYSIPFTCPCLCPPKLVSFRYGQAFQPKDLGLCVRDAAGQHYAPAAITYTLYQVAAGGQKIVVGPYRRTPSQQSLGTYYATGVAGDLGQPGEWRIVWRYEGPRGPVEVEQPFLVTATPVTTSCGCAPTGWE
jgi:hypothetical protein